MSIDAVIATARFGFGARPGELRQAGPDPRGWLRTQLEGDDPPLPEVPPTAARLKLFFEARGAGDAEVMRLLRQEFRQGFLADLGHRTRRAAVTLRPFRERLVHFWSNHFTVSAVRPAVAGIAVPFEEEAIRPHVTGRFADLLRAATRHPAMLFYLDQAVSVGPGSRAGLRRRRGLNENLARELLELHTLGVSGGYSQADVRALAEMLTGWTVGNARFGVLGEFAFRPNVHEPGTKTFLGATYAERGGDEGLAALDALAAHPATARHVAAKLARHFVADQPPAETVDRLSRIFLETGGDLGAVSRALVVEEAIWRTPLAKVRTPGEFLVAALRATGAKTEGAPLLRALATLGQTPLTAPSPAGWPDDAASWAAPEAMLRRVEFALAFAGRLRPKAEPAEIAAESLGDVLSDETGRAIRQAGSRTEGLALLLASPEFQRR